MTPKTRTKSAKANAKEPNPKQMTKLYINTRENDSKNTKRSGHCGASVRSEDKETALQDTANAAANVSAEPPDSIQPDEPWESAGVPSPAALPEWNGRRQRTTSSKRYFYQYTYRRLTEDVEVEVANFFVELVAATIMVHMKKDPN